MDFLLDTHVFLWYISGDERLPKSFRDVIRDMENNVYLSVVSLWETIIKHQLGRLPLPQPPEIYLPQQREQHLIASLPVREADVARLAQLPPIHRDPFDRIMICQAITHDMIFATVDKTVLRYPAAFLPRL
jgi:PIN domain nuclease of toxin-antitoxin system